jgi:hypothetical protein
MILGIIIIITATRMLLLRNKIRYVYKIKYYMYTSRSIYRRKEENITLMIAECDN